MAVDFGRRVASALSRDLEEPSTTRAMVPWRSSRSATSKSVLSGVLGETGPPVPSLALEAKGEDSGSVLIKPPAKLTTRLALEMRRREKAATTRTAPIGADGLSGQPVPRLAGPGFEARSASASFRSLETRRSARESPG